IDLAPGHLVRLDRYLPHSGNATTPETEILWTVANPHAGVGESGFGGLDNGKPRPEKQAAQGAVAFSGGKPSGMLDQTTDGGHICRGAGEGEQDVNGFGLEPGRWEILKRHRNEESLGLSKLRQQEWVGDRQEDFVMDPGAATKIVVIAIAVVDDVDKTTPGGLVRTNELDQR